MSEHAIVIVGTGFSGLGAAIRLKQEGIDDFVVLERSGDVGGTWHFNTYPGCRCDIPSHLYSFSFAPNPDWSNTFSHQFEIQAYLKRCAADFGILPHVRFHTEMLDAAWDDDAQRWRIQTSQGDLEAQTLILGPGGLAEPKLPDVPGIESFEGTAFHSARWDHGHDLAGERVAVIGTGASAIQFVPQIAPKVAQLHVFQRTPPWITRHGGRDTRPFERRLYRRLPATQKLVRGSIWALHELLVPGLRGNRLWQAVMKAAGIKHLYGQVKDPQLRRKLKPGYAMGCKRILISNDYYPALTRPNVDVITDGIAEVRPRSIVTRAGQEIEVDTIIMGTGFQVTDIPIAQRIAGRGGRRLADEWDGSPGAYLGTTIAGYPNLFLLTGPNTGLGHNSIVYMIESQLHHVIAALKAMRRAGAAAIEVKPEAQQRFVDEVQSMMPGTVWVSGGCASWYIDRHGRNTTLWPTFTFRFRERARRFDPAAYVFERPRTPAAPARRPAARPAPQPA
ncbi:MAG TPA: NAD(P)/FAD-dependent oxidoreductase [Solirubrobacteraceae bacterium]|nr:NAD(P)/FAD-dependent oxidoreductase [Solirubrobacteraceae bacterium]